MVGWGRRVDTLLCLQTWRKAHIAATRAVKNALKLEPLKEERREFLGTHTQNALRENPYLKKLLDHLLEIGGEAVVLWNGSNGERFVADLIALGEVQPNARLRMKRGEPGNCHENSRQLALKRPEQYLKCTGYALSDDSVWRPHSWVWDLKADRIIETTEGRVIYFGLIELVGTEGEMGAADPPCPIPSSQRGIVKWQIGASCPHQHPAEGGRIHVAKLAASS